MSVVGAPPAEACAAARFAAQSPGSVNGQMLPTVVELADAGKFHISVEKRMPLAMRRRRGKTIAPGTCAARSF